MTKNRITEADLDWWVTLSTTLEWTFATTYAETAPHSYVVLGRTAGMSETSPDGRLKWWTMDADVSVTTLINQATTDRLYGVQNAPVTDSEVATEYDAVATFYDRDHSLGEATARALRDAMASLRGHYQPSVLDIGCGTGRVLDLELTTPDRYAGVDPSQPMLNQLVRKHPRVAAVYPMTIEQALDQRLFTSGQFEVVTVLLAESDRLSEQAFDELAEVASLGLVAARDDTVTVIDRMRRAPAVTRLGA